MTSFIANLNEADRILHSLAQLLALTGTNRLPPQPDDSQANLNWNPAQQQLEGRPFDQNGHLVRLVVDLPGDSLQFLTADNQPIATFGIAGKTPTDAKAWWLEVLHGWGLSTNTPLNYQLDKEPVAEQTPYQWPADLSPWAEWRTLANETLQTLNTQSGQFSEVRIWPHHFDTGVYYSFPDETGKEQAAIWAGYAIADSLSEEPYFYLAGYDTRNAIDFGTATSLSVGNWLITPNWKGAFLPVSEAAGSDRINSFFRESYDWLFAKING